MLHSEAIGHRVSRSKSRSIDHISVEVIIEIEKELQCSPYDVISLVFLLYDVPDTALQRLIVYQRVSADLISTNLHLLHKWAQSASANTRPTWKHEFLEALLICQLYGIVQKLGFDISTVKKHYQPENLYVNMHINPMKKALYKVCESIGSDNLMRLKRTLRTFNIETEEFETCELIFLKLMSEKFIIISQKDDKKVLGYEYKVDKLVKILKKLPGLEDISKELRSLQCSNDESSSQPAATSSLLKSPSDFSQPKPEEACMTANEFTELFEMMNGLNIEEHIKSDTKKVGKECYKIKDAKRVGVCLIINQEEFFLSDKSIEDESLTTVLSKRIGTAVDKMRLMETMLALNFKVVIGDNLNHTDMIDFIKDTIQNHVQQIDSIFMLCILSHGVRGHVYSADCVKVSIEDIQGILDSDEAHCLWGIPKVLIIQACQVDERSQLNLVADSPTPSVAIPLKKSDFLVYWATAPQYEAFRHEKSGSIFIQMLCSAIQKRARQEPLYDIFTLVNNGVTSLCMRHKYLQVPIFETTLRKKLYLQVPE